MALARKRFDIRISSEVREPLDVDGIANVLLDFLAQQLEACTGSDAQDAACTCFVCSGAAPGRERSHGSAVDEQSR
jgi:hypothetical protein